MTRIAKDLFNSEPVMKIIVYLLDGSMKENKQIELATGIERSTFFQTINSLIKKGLITIDKKSSPSAQRVSKRYCLVKDFDQFLFLNLNYTFNINYSKYLSSAKLICSLKSKNRSKSDNKVFTSTRSRIKELQIGDEYLYQLFNYYLINVFPRYYNAITIEPLPDRYTINTCLKAFGEFYDNISGDLSLNVKNKVLKRYLKGITFRDVKYSPERVLAEGDFNRMLKLQNMPSVNISEKRQNYQQGLLNLLK